MERARILICEDEGIVAKDIQNRLKKMGYTVSAVVDSGEKAIKTTGEISPDLVLMDIRLKGEMDGIEAAEKIHNNFDIPVIYLTANADASTWERTQMTQPFGYIIKPFKEKQLQATLEIALGKYRLERKLKEREQWLATVLASIGDAVIATDSQGQITFMNLAAEALTGWTHEELLGKDSRAIFTLTDSETGTPLENPLKKVLHSGIFVTVPSETLLIAKNGARIPISDCTTPLIDDKGNLTGAVWVFRDMRLAKRLELAELKSNFITMTNHEFRTPLTTILSSAELLEHYGDKFPQEKQLKHLHRIQISAKYMSEMLNQVLILDRAQAGKLEFNPVPLNLAAWCRELVESVQMGVGRQHVLAFTHQVDGTVEAQGLSLESIPADVDENLLRHILTNLLSNAIKYSPQGSTVQFSLIQQDDKAIFKIQDFGMGIPLKDQTQLFESFYRASNVSNIQGTGIGLAIVKNCVELHGGDISVESAVGVGTTFTVTLPMYRRL